MPTFRPDKQHITAADGTVFQAACYSPGYDWSQHVIEEVKSELGEVPADYDWTQHVSVETREEVRQKCCEQAGSDALAYAKSLGEKLGAKAEAVIAKSELHDGTAVRYETPTPEAEEKKALFEAVRAKTKDYTVAMVALSEIAKNPDLTPAEAVAAAKQ
mgnify:FL=1